MKCPLFGVRIGACLVVLVAVTTTGAADQRVPMLPSASDPVRQGFIRIINHSKVAGKVVIVARDDPGRPIQTGLVIGADETVHFNSDDLESGNEAKGLVRGIGPGVGDWNLWLQGRSLDDFGHLSIEVLAYIRTQDGFLTAMHDVVERREDGIHRVPTFNPGRNDMQVSLLRLVNPSPLRMTVNIVGIDGNGRRSERVRVSLGRRDSRLVSAQELEAGGEGLDGALGTGAGKWQLLVEPSYQGEVDPDERLIVMSLLRSPTDHLTNLSSAPPSQRSGMVSIPLFPAADRHGRQGFVRVINHSAQAGQVTVNAWDDSGRRYDPITLDLDANETAHFNSGDLETGNPDKGLANGIGMGQGDWRLQLSSDLDIEVLAYIRTSDGFLTSMHDLVPRGGSRHEVAFFNPGSNVAQVSHIRITNAGGGEARVAARGLDGHRRSPGSEIRFSIPVGASVTHDAAELESGATDMEGSLGDGEDKWQLFLEADQPIRVMSLLQSPTGHLTNLSSAPERVPFDDEFPDSPLIFVHNDNVVVVESSEDLTRADPDLDGYASAFYEWYADDFDFLLFLSNLGDHRESAARYLGSYHAVRNDVEGIGRDPFYVSAYGSAERLRGAIHFATNADILSGPSLHEIQHAWSNYTVATATHAHWGFSSADGQLGGFRRANLVDRGNGRFTAGRFGTFANGGNGVPYSPIELYYAGFLAASEVPDLWVAADGRWLREDGDYVTDDDGHVVFTAANIAEYSIGDLVNEYGPRDPDHTTARRDFRAAVLLLTNDRYPLLYEQIDRVSEDASWFGHRGEDLHEGYERYNFHEATGGRASIALDGLSAFRKAEAGMDGLPASFGIPPPPHLCRIAPGGFGWVHEESTGSEGDGRPIPPSR